MRRDLDRPGAMVVRITRTGASKRGTLDISVKSSRRIYTTGTTFRLSIARRTTRSVNLRVAAVQSDNRPRFRSEVR
jgi:hypothetical protein